MLPTLRAINNDGSHLAANSVLVTFSRFIILDRFGYFQPFSGWKMTEFKDKTVPEVNVRSSSLSTKETSFE